MVAAEPLVSPSDREAVADKRLRDLGEGEFYQRYGCDRFVAALLVNRFRYIVQHMTTKLMTNAFSFMIRDMMDFCVTISGPPEIGWPMPSTSPSNAVHWGAAADTVRVMFEEYGVDRLRPGDLMISNDSYRLGKHLNDMAFVRPLFHENRLIGAVHVTAHQLDLGSRTPAGFDMSSRTIWEDGLVLPPVLLCREGEFDKSVFNLIAANTRFPEAVLPDLSVIQANLALGEQLIRESIGKYGLDAYFGAMRYACDGAAEAMTRAIEALPEGRYEGRQTYDSDCLPDSPEYELVLSVVKSGSRLEIDFSGTSENSRSALNCHWVDVKSGVLLGLKMLLDPKHPANSGTLRNVDMLLPPGSMIYPDPPAATMSYYELVEGIVQAIFQALGPVLGERAPAPNSSWVYLHHAHGRTLSGKEWANHAIATSMSSVPWGGTAAGDGDSNSLMPWLNFIDSGVEPREAMAPMVILSHEAMIDTAGPGQHRGGAGTRTDVLWCHAGVHRGTTLHAKAPSQGVSGGQAGKLGGAWMLNPAGTPEVGAGWPDVTPQGAAHRQAIALAGLIDRITNQTDPCGDYVSRDEPVAGGAGAIVRAIGSGAGGWGAPLTRDPDQVLRDVRDEYISVAAAARDYGVVVLGDPQHDPEALRIDAAETARLRERS